MYNKALLLLLTLSMVFVSCADNTDSDPETPLGIIESSLAYFEGKIVEKTIEKVNGIDAWKIKIENEIGSILSFYWQIGSLILIQVDGSRGPFNYDLSPGTNLINFSSARTLAMGQVQNTNILNWILRQDIDRNNKYLYVFDFENSSNLSIKIYVDAENGNILQID